VQIAERVRAAVEALHIAHDEATSGQVTVSIGIASFVPLTGNARQLVSAADAALYSAKRGGRNTVATHDAVAFAEAG
jgi:two-component system, chemotaxis family, response regulator WspR